MNTMKSFLYFLLLIGFLSCSSNEVNPENVEHDLSFPFTLSSSENMYSMEIDGVSISKSANLLTTLNDDIAMSINLEGPNNDFDFARLNSIPRQKGTFKAGHDLGPANGTFGNNLFLMAFVKKDGKKHFAYSAHEYGFLEEERVPGSSATIEIMKYEGGIANFRFMNFTLRSFIGTIEGKFAGTFKTKEGQEVKVTKGQFRIVGTLPPGAEVLD